MYKLASSSYLLGTSFAEHIPEPESLVPGTSNYGLPIGWHGQVQHPISVAGELGHLGEEWVTPHQDLVLTIPMSGNLWMKPVLGVPTHCIDGVVSYRMISSHYIIYYTTIQPYHTTTTTTHQFRCMFGPGQIAHLRSSINTLHGLPRQGVPEAYAAVGCPTPTSQQPVVVRWPGNSCGKCFLSLVQAQS